MLAEEHAGDTSLAALMASTVGEGCMKRVVALVDVRTGDGDDASAIFADILRGLGARVSRQPDILDIRSVDLGSKSPT